MNKIVPTFDEFLNEGKFDEADALLTQVSDECKKEKEASNKIAKKEGFQDLEGYFEYLSVNMHDKNVNLDYEELQNKNVEKALLKVSDICEKYAKKHAKPGKETALLNSLYSAVVEGGAYMTILNGIDVNLKK